MRTGWECRQLAELADLVSTGPFGSMLHKSDYVSSGVPLINPINIADERIVPDHDKQVSPDAIVRLASYVLRSGDVVVARRGEIGRCAVVGPDAEGWVCGTGCFFVRPKETLDAAFLAHLLRSPHYRELLARSSTGATMRNMSNAALAQLPISVPAVDEQHRIVAMLDEAFEGIATAKANAEKNLQNARELFESQREAVLSNGGSGWDEAPLSELCDIKHGYAFEGEFFAQEGHYVLLTPGNYFESGGYRDRGDKQKYFTGPVQSDYILPERSLLVAMTEQAAGLLGSPLLVPEPDRFLHNQRLGLVVSKPSVAWLNDFFFHVFNLRRVRAEIHATASGVKVRHTSPGKIGAVRVAFPKSLPEQRKVASELDFLGAKCETLASIFERKLAALDELKKALLYQAFSGAL